MRSSEHGGAPDEEAGCTEQQIARVRRQAEQGTAVAELCRKLGDSETTFYAGRKRYAGMGVAELRRVQGLEEENRRLKQVVADLTLDKAGSRTCSQKGVRPARRGEMVATLVAADRVPKRRACEAVQCNRVTFYDLRARRTAGRTGRACGWTSAGRASPCITPSSRASMGGCGTSISTPSVLLGGRRAGKITGVATRLQ